MTPEEMKMIEGIIELCKNAYSAGGWLALLPVALPSLVQLYKADFVQGFLPERMRYSVLKPGAQFGLAFAITALPVFLTKLVTSGLASAAVLAVTAGLAATFTYAKGLKPATTSNPASRAIAYAPKTVRNSLGMIAKVDQAKIDGWVKMIEEKRKAKAEQNQTKVK